MSDLPSHTLPDFSETAKDDALFHYTTAAGLAGILRSNTIWGTAYYCTNDEQELSAGRGVLTSLFRDEIYRLERMNDPRINIFYGRGVRPHQYADSFEDTIVNRMLGALCAYITCFCKASTEEDFRHGLLSQWRGYGSDGGYCIQLSRRRLQAGFDRMGIEGKRYELKDVQYNASNALRDDLLRHKDAFLRAFGNHLDELAKPIDTSRTTWPSPLKDLLPDPLAALLDYLVHTKNRHFSEERECRLTLVQPTLLSLQNLSVHSFARNGLLVPYVATPNELDVLSCVDWIIIGPAPRMGARFKSVTHLVEQSGRDIKVRPSHIPFTRQ